MVDVGQPAPPFRLESTAGTTRDLAGLRGKKVVLYFYPKDDTPGCTREACDFRDNLDAIRAAGAVVLGVSKDSLASHDRFKGKYNLPFELLSDPDNEVAAAYGAYGQKTLYGKTFTGTIRSTFVIDEEGRIAAKWSNVKVDGHVDKVLDVLTGNGGPKVAARAAKTAAKKAPARASAGARKTSKKISKKVTKKPGKKAASKKASGKKAAKKPAKKTKAGKTGKTAKKAKKAAKKR